MINLLELFTNLFNSALMVYTFYLFFAYFAEKRLNKWLHFLLLSLIGLALTCILSFVPMGMLRTVLICLIPLLVSILFKLKWYSHFLLSVLIYATGGILEFVTTILLSLLFSVDTQTATEGAFRILGIVLSKMLMLLVLAIMKIFKYKFSYSLTVKKTLTLLIIPVSTTVISLLHINLFVKFPAQSQTLVYSSLASYIVLILSNIVVFHLIDNSYRESEKEKQVTILTELLNAQTKQYEQMQEHNQEVMKIRHDQKNFLIGIISELESGNVDATKKLLKEQLTH